MNKVILAIALLLILISCQREDDLDFISVKPKYEIEGQYSGRLRIVCKSYNNYDKTYDNVWNITSFDKEKLAIETNKVTASAILSSTGQSYDYLKYFTYSKECTLIVFTYSGSGQVNGDTLREFGTVLIYYGSNDLPMYGTFEGMGVKIK